MTGPGGNTDNTGTLRQQIAILTQQYGDRYDIGYAGGCWLAIRAYASSTPSEPLAGATPELLALAIAADWATGGAA